MYHALAAGVTLAPKFAQALDRDGFVVIPGPVPQPHLAQLAQAYDHQLLHAQPSDIGHGSTTTRLHDFVNRGPAFDPLYVYPPVLEAACRVIGQPFRLSSLLARTLNPKKPAQTLHVDFPGDRSGWPMLGFIFMVDEFRPENGATLFGPGSQGADAPPQGTGSLTQACGPAGSMIVYNGSTWHGHAANCTAHPRRSIQGAYIRRNETAAYDFAGRIDPETLARLSPLAKYLLAL
jgi:ectoine hydroxylase-related dioxygenase (phytanoyl-CoA dioxygenase family)